MKKTFVIIMMITILILSGCGKQVNQNVLNNSSEVQAIASLDSEDAAFDSDLSVYEEQELIGADMDSDIIEIKEKLFIAQTNDIYLNTNDYLGKTIKYEGIFDKYTWEENGKTYNYVIRYGPGCCGYDANAGFEVEWNGDYPNQNDWVEAIGVLELYEEDGNQYLRLVLESLTVLAERGAEYVSQ